MKLDKINKIYLVGDLTFYKDGIKPKLAFLSKKEANIFIEEKKKEGTEYKIWEVNLFEMEK